MAVEIAVADHLLGDSGVVALAGNRGYVGKFPENFRQVGFRVTLVTEAGLGHLRGRTQTKPALIQVDSVAPEASGVDPYTQATDLADAIDAAMGFEPFTEGGLEVAVTERPTRSF